jgi:citrate lyase subunit beta / citryl-CoA lyase
MNRPIARSWLFVPGNRPERFDKACVAGADAVIVDLEDAVPPSEKAAARAALASWLRPGQPVVVRINGADTAWFEGDLALCAQPGLAGIMLPKAERREVLARLAAIAPAVPLLPLIETAVGFANAGTLARTPQVQRLVFGSIDFQVDLGIDGDGEELHYFRSQLVLVSRLGGIQPPVDGVCTAIDDADVLRADTLRGRRFGFGGKLCIHPRQVAAVNACWRPAGDEVAWAERVLAAGEAAQGQAVAVDGKMVDRPVLLRAERILAEARRVT